MKKTPAISQSMQMLEYALMQVSPMRYMQVYFATMTNKAEFRRMLELMDKLDAAIENNKKELKVESKSYRK